MSTAQASDRFTSLPDDQALATTVVALEEHGFSVEVVDDRDAAVADNFSDRLLKNPKIVQANSELNEWHTVTYPGRLPGLKWLRTLWVASLAGGHFSTPAESCAMRISI
jgi:hypothetical protein